MLSEAEEKFKLGHYPTKLQVDTAQSSRVGNLAPSYTTNAGLRTDLSY